MNYKQKEIVDFIIAHDLQFNLFKPLYKLKYEDDANQETVDRALIYFETGR
jgi:hypothetical protein